VWPETDPLQYILSYKLLWYNNIMRMTVKNMYAPIIMCNDNIMYLHVTFQICVYHASIIKTTTLARDWRLQTSVKIMVYNIDTTIIIYKCTFYTYKVKLHSVLPMIHGRNRVWLEITCLMFYPHVPKYVSTPYVYHSSVCAIKLISIRIIRIWSKTRNDRNANLSS